jgi:S1-C subfamily serine protease
MKSLVLSLCLSLSFAICSARSAETVVPALQDASVTIRAGQSQGSGVLFTRGDRTYVWTAAHVIDSQRVVRTVVVNGVEKTLVEFRDVNIVQEFRQEGRRIGEASMECRVIRYSDSEQGEDLALLEVRKKNFSTATVQFYDGAIPEIGTELFHVGSLLGQFGSNSLTTGVYSQIGRVLDIGTQGTIFDQTTVTAFPGSSGGGVFLKENGQYVGMLVRGSGEQFNFIVPVRRLREWAVRAKVEWAINLKVPVPSEEELAKIPVEDAGITGLQLESARSPKSLEYPFLLLEPKDTFNLFGD